MHPFVTSRAEVQMPRLIYGTAWKADKTADFVEKAIAQGFRGIDTAGQPKHYNEAGVGEGLKRAQQSGVKRHEIFIQTKYTPMGGQDPSRVPYDPAASLAEQVRQSVAASKQNLQIDTIDSLVLHSPLPKLHQLFTVWQAMEELMDKGEVRQLGISNCYDPDLFQELFTKVRIKPAVLQNRFYWETRYDVGLRQFCREKQIYYQSFWTLTANPHILGDPVVVQIAEQLGKTPVQVFFRYLTQQSIIPLTGTTSTEHMIQDLSIFEFELDTDQCDRISQLGL